MLSARQQWRSVATSLVGKCANRFCHPAHIGYTLPLRVNIFARRYRVQNSLYANSSAGSLLVTVTSRVKVHPEKFASLAIPFVMTPPIDVATQLILLEIPILSHSTRLSQLEARVLGRKEKKRKGKEGKGREKSTIARRRVFALVNSHDIPTKAWFPQCGRARYSRTRSTSLHGSVHPFPRCRVTFLTAGSTRRDTRSRPRARQCASDKPSVEPRAPEPVAPRR